MQIGWIYMDNPPSSLYGMAWEVGRKKETARKWTRNRKQI
jgi:hypothetical protein